tara:strand:+ start:11656 stop:14124 length:2469 start_codon:yes stop_codon:yes gene_type:complete
LDFSDSHFEYIKGWIRPLQKSLTLESESEFNNLLGKEKYFNEYLFESLENLDHLKLQKEYIERFNYFCTKYKEYNILNISQRKRLIVDTRKILFKLSKSIENKEDKENKSNKNYYFEQKLKGTSLKISSELSEINGIGKIYQDNLNKLGLFNIKDLIKYFPRTYLDYSNKEKIINLKPEAIYTCTGNIKKFYMYRSKKKSYLSIMNITLSDETGSIKITKFFLGKRFSSYSFFSTQKNKFKLGIKLAVSGKVKMTEYGRSFVDPQIEILNTNENNLNFSGKILPIYSLTDSISNLRYIKIMKRILVCSNQYPDILSSKQLDSLSLFSINEALINIHLPKDQFSLKESKKRLLFDELLLLQIKFLIKKNKRQSIVLRDHIKEKKSYLKQFLNNIPFCLTKSQIRVLEEIKVDLKGSSPMSRLLQGDVGSGKTIVAIASLLFIVENGFQGAIMVPTEVLAVQHYQNLIKNLTPLFVSVELLTGNTTQKKRRRILKELSTGEINILVGTHALFEDKVIFNSLGLVVIDEQHRFGVSQRNRLLRKGDNTHLLSMTATPIPRTLALSIYGDLDVSKIDELPPGRIPVKTKIIKENNLSELFKIVEKEIKKGKQAYVILPLIEESEKLNLNSINNTYKYLSEEIFNQFQLGILHGKLNSEEKNNIIDLFIKNKINILVSTTVIEVGIDVPNASIMIIYNSERFGLSQLHQLRGRVGRDSYRSFCYLVTSENNESVNKRLEVMQSSNDGFYIAEKDLELRGPGQILGYKQSGIPDFILNNLPSHKLLIESARKEAMNILLNDPLLEKNIILKKVLFEKDNNKFVHDFLN